MDIPFLRDDLLPDAIPTIETIRSAESIFTGREKSAFRRVVAIGKHFLVKYGRIQPIEAQNLLFLEHHLPEIPAPRLFALWEEPGPFNEYHTDSYLVMVMELLEGESLEHQWPHLSFQDQSIIFSKLKIVFDTLRGLPSSGRYSSVSGGPMPHYMFLSRPEDSDMSGPFNNGQQFITALAKKSRTNWQENQKFSCLADFYERNFTPALQHHPPVLTHSDVQRKNIVVQKIGTDETATDWKVGVVDWEACGWYPAYWEYFAAFLAFRWNEDDWPIQVERFIQPYGPEAAMLKMIYQDLFW